MSIGRKRAWLACCLAACLLLCTACGARREEPGDRLRVVTSFYPMYIFTLNVTQGVPGVSVRNMAAPEVGCLHDYQLLPADLRALESADALVISGAGMEEFMDKVRAQYRELPVIEAAAALEETCEHEEDHEDHASDEGEAHEGHAGHDHVHNPHVWLDPRKAAVQVRAIGAGLAQVDPDHAAQYTANAEACARRLEALYMHMQAALATVSSREIVTFHEAFEAFADAFALTVVGVIEREPGTEPGTRDMANLVDMIRASGVRALLVEPQYPARVAEIIARETGVPLRILDPVVTGPLRVTAYEEIMTRNLTVLLEALR